LIRYTPTTAVCRREPAGGRQVFFRPVFPAGLNNRTRGSRFERSFRRLCGRRTDSARTRNTFRNAGRIFRFGRLHCRSYRKKSAVSFSLGAGGWRLWAGDITRYCLVFFFFSFFFFFLLFVGNVKTGSFENYSNAARDKTAYFFPTFGAFFDRLVAHRLKNFETVAAFFTFIFICGHGKHTIAKTWIKVKIFHLRQGAASL